MDCNNIMDHTEKQGEEPLHWELCHTVSHQGALSRIHHNCNGSPHNIQVEWENGEITDESLNIIAEDAPVACAIHTKKNNLLNKPRWKQFKRLAQRHSRFFTETNKAKIRLHFSKPKFKCGIEVPKNCDDAVRLDGENGNTLWQDAVKLELELMQSHKVFKDNGKHSPVPDGHKNIQVHLIFDVKHDGRHCGRLVADGHLTDIPLESDYSGVVSLRGF